MNLLSLDFGTKKIGLAYSTEGIISTLPALNNNAGFIDNLKKIIDEYYIDKIYVGLSEGYVAGQTLKFVAALSPMIKLPIETVEESVSTIEAAGIFKNNRHPGKKYKKDIDSVAAAVILRRVIS